MPGLEHTDGDSAGARLARARARLGLTVDQVAEKLRLDPHTVVALEAGDHQVIGAAVFVRGFLRRYAELVGESPSEIETLHSLRPDADTQPDLSKTGMHRIEPDAHGRKLGVLPALIAAAVLGVVGAVWWAVRAKPYSESTVSVSTVSLEQTQVVHDAVVVVAPAMVAPAAVAPPATTSAPVAVPVPVPGGRRRHLQLTFNSESWAEVYDARGMRLYFGFGHTGSSPDLNGVPPFRLVLGNAEGVAVSIDDTPVALPPATPGARLRVSVNGNGAVASVR